MSNHVPPKVGLDFAEQFWAQGYASVIELRDERKKLAELTTKASEAQLRLEATDRELFSKLKLLDEVNGKLGVAQRELEERTKRAEEKRVELSGVESRLAAADAKVAQLLKTFKREG